MVADDFHDPPALHGVELVVIPVEICYANDAHSLNRSSISTIRNGDQSSQTLRFLLICKGI
jgi:hypothetical protein